MCGICGVALLDAAGSPEPRTLEAMSATLAHRGPDAAGLAVEDGAALAVRRLAIIDVQGGDQPLRGEDGQAVLVCNGEIYNYRELRDDLARRGHRFQTGSDCETIVHGYEEYGDEVLDRLNGMFALALWDARRKRLLLARDRAGIKPLYYAEFAGRLLFASEVKAILAYPGFPRELDLVALNQYLTYEYVPTPRSIFKGIRKLRPGHLAALEAGTFREQPYWSLDLTPRPLQGTLRDQSAQLWDVLKEVVRKELISDVPVGAFLSGGLDSSAVTAAMVELGANPRTFSIGFDDPSFDESRFAQQVADHLGTQHSVLELSSSMLPELMPAAADLLDEPLADPSILPTLLLSRFARPEVVVALGGDGGDELFAGYPTLQAHRLMGYYNRLPGLLRESLIPSIVNRLPVSDRNLSVDFRAKRFVGAAALPAAPRHHLWMGAFSPEQKTHLLQPDVLEQLDAADTFEPLTEHLSNCAGCDDLSQILYLDMKMYLEGNNLVKVDRASMACSLEVRVPLLNIDLLEFVGRLPLDLKLHRMTPKYLLRKALAGKLPPDIINRPKKGFGIPVTRWLRGELRELMLDSLGERRLREQGLFRPEFVQGIMDQHLQHRWDHRKPLWGLIMFELWYDRYMKGVSPCSQSPGSDS